MVIYEGGDVGIEAEVFRVSNLPWIIIDSQESIRLNLDPVDIKLPAFVFQTINLMETVQRLNRLPDGGKQNPYENQEPNPHETTKQKKRFESSIYHIHWRRSTLRCRNSTDDRDSLVFPVSRTRSVLLDTVAEFRYSWHYPV